MAPLVRLLGRPAACCASVLAQPGGGGRTQVALQVVAPRGLNVVLSSNNGGLYHWNRHCFGVLVFVWRFGSIDSSVAG